MTTYVLYHGNCWDGFGAAWAAWMRLKDQATYIPVNYGAPPPEMPDCDRLYILDFSYPKETLLELAKKHCHVTLLDHHKTAQSDLGDLVESRSNQAHEFDVELTQPGLYVRFNVEESGASLAWEYFYEPDKWFSGQQKWTPEIIKYVKDRDLWEFKMPHSREVTAWLHSFPFDFEQWKWLNHCLTDDGEFVALLPQGAAILRAQQQQIEAMCRHAGWITLCGYTVPVVNATTLFSECGEYLCEKYPDAPFAAYYFDRADGKRQWGLRSRNSFDVSAIAKRYGGGGHVAAAGFQFPGPALLKG